MLFSHFSSVQLAHSCSAPFTRLEHVGPSAFLSARLDGHCLQHDGREPGSPDCHACSLAGTHGLAILVAFARGRPFFLEMSPQHCRPKGRLLKTCLSLALKSPWCRSSTLPGQKTSCISPAVKTKSLGPTSSHQSCRRQTLRLRQCLPRTLPAKPKTASTEAPKPCPSPPCTQWPDAPGLPDDALPAKSEVILKAAPKPRPLPSEASARAPTQGNLEPALRLATSAFLRVPRTQA